MTRVIPRAIRQAIGILGVVLLDFGIALTQITFKGGTISQWNGLCRKGLGQALGLTAQDCVLAARVDRVIGWLVGQGLAFIVGYVILRFSRISLRSPSTARNSPAGQPASRARPSSEASSASSRRSFLAARSASLSRCAGRIRASSTSQKLRPLLISSARWSDPAGVQSAGRYLRRRPGAVTRRRR